MANWSELDYIRTVDAIAEEALKEYPSDVVIPWDGRGGRSQYIHESVGGNEYVNCHSANDIALRASQNEPDGEEVRARFSERAHSSHGRFFRGLLEDDTGQLRYSNWRTMRSEATYLAMVADVNESMERQRKERTDGKICRTLR